MKNCRMLRKVLSKAGFTHVDLRTGAAVPIGSSFFLLYDYLLTYLSQAQFRDPKTGLDCDINVNDRLGLINSSMIKDYCDAHPFVRPLLYSIKNWAKPLGLNSPSPPRGNPATFSSYAFALMTISFLQVRSFRYTIHFPQFLLLNLCNRKRAISQIYREIFLLLQSNSTRNLSGLVNHIEVGMFDIIYPKNGLRHLFLILIHCCLRGTRKFVCLFCINGSSEIIRLITCLGIG